jgi:hypothetical protein
VNTDLHGILLCCKRFSLGTASWAGTYQRFCPACGWRKKSRKKEIFLKLFEVYVV